MVNLSKYLCVNASLQIHTFGCLDYFPHYFKFSNDFSNCFVLFYMIGCKIFRLRIRFRVVSCFHDLIVGKSKVQ